MVCNGRLNWKRCLSPLLQFDSRKTPWILQVYIGCWLKRKHCAHSMRLLWEATKVVLPAKCTQNENISCWTAWKKNWNCQEIRKAAKGEGIKLGNKEVLTSTQQSLQSREQQTYKYVQLLYTLSETGKSQRF